MKHIRLRLLVTSAFALLVAACSQVPTPQAQPDTQLTPQFGTQNDDRLSQIAVSKNLNAVFAAGYTYGSLETKNARGADGYLRRYNRDGTLAWGVQFGGTNDRILVGLTLDNSNHVYIAGNIESDEAPYNSSGFLKQYSADGKLVWGRDIIFGEDTDILGVAADIHGGVFLTGFAEPYMFISKYSRRGDVLWTKTYSGVNLESPQTDQYGNLYVFNGGKNQIRKYSGSGKLVWTKKVGEASNIRAPFSGSLKVVDDAVYFTGYKEWQIGPDSPETDAYVAKLDLAGNLKWAKSFGTKVEDTATSATADSKGNVYVVGNTYGTLGGRKAGSTDVFIRKYSSAGKVIWTRQFGTSRAAFSPSIATFSSNELYVGGEFYGDFGAGYQGSADVFLARLDSSGNRTWIR